MKYLAAAALMSLIATGAIAQTPAAKAPAASPPAAVAAPGATCKVQATDKKLAGAALKSFMTKCQKDASTSCTKTATGQKLAGAAKTSFTKKCVSDAVGA